MAKFDLKGILSEESRKEMKFQKPSGTVYRDVFELIPSEKNFYNTSPESLEDLKSSIQLFGVMQDISIKSVDGKDHIVSGHRRTLCCRLLVEEGHEEFRKIGCKYVDFTERAQGVLAAELETLSGLKERCRDDEEKTKMTQEILEHMAIIQANRFRKMTDWERMQEVIETERDIQELRKVANLEGKTRDMIKKTLNVSGTQIARYQSVNNNLSEELMEAFKQNKLNISVAAELAGLKPEYQQQAYEIFQRDGNISINDAKVLKARQEQENLPGQMTIEQALHPAKPQEVATAIPVDTQIDRFFEALRKSVSVYILQNNLNMTIYMLSALYGSVRVRNGHLNYQGQKEGILFNGDSEQEELVPWKDFSERLIKKYGKKQKQVKTASVVEKEPENNMPGPAKCITGQSGSGQCGAATYCDKGYNCCSQCSDDCNGRCGWIESCQPAAEAPDEKQHGEIEEYIVEDSKTPDRTEDSETTLPENWPEFLKDIPIPSDVALTECLRNQEIRLKQMVDLKQQIDPDKAETEVPDKVIARQQMTVAGLRLLQNLIKSQEQPPLPKMKNNDQRKEWLRNYKSWGLWYTDYHTGVRYYKYDFQNGARLITEEYDPEPQKSSWWVPTELYYMHLVGGPEPASKDKIPKWTYHEKYSRFPNSEPELVEFLKEVQK